MKIIPSLLLCLGLVASAYAQTAVIKWKSLKPLHSTRKDVEKLYGAAQADSFITPYQNESEKISVTYSETTCKENESAYWDVPIGTVLSFVVEPKTFLSPQDFINQIGLAFERTSDTETPRRFNYRSQDQAISFNAEILSDKGEQVLSIFYSPAAADNKLRCSGEKFRKGSR